MSVRFLWLLLVAVLVDVGYWVRPYDMLADRRRWRWQRRQDCLGLTLRGRDGSG